jgi:hypothetical protein
MISSLFKNKYKQEQSNSYKVARKKRNGKMKLRCDWYTTNLRSLLKL